MNRIWHSHQGWPLQRKLALYVALAVMLGAAIAAPFLVASLRSEIQREVLDARAADARYIASIVDREVALRLRALTTLSAPVAELVKAGSKGALNNYLQDHVVTQSLFSRDLYILSSDGQRVAESPQRGNIGADQSNAVYFQRAKATGQPVIQPLVGRFAKLPVIVFAAPLLDADGTFLGVLCGSELVGVGTPFDFSLKTKPGSSQGYHLISRADDLYVSSTESALVMSKLAPKGQHPLLDRRREGWVEPTIALDIHGKQVLSAAANLSNVDWYVVALVSTEEAFAVVNQSIVQMASAVGLVALALALFLWLLLRRELSPIARAATQLNAVSMQGTRWSDLPISGTGEVRVLLQNLNQLHQHLEEKGSQLEQERDRLQRTLAEREALNAELAHSESRYRALVVSASQCVWRFQAGGTSVDAESARWWCEFSGQTDAQRTADGGAGWLSAVHPEDRDRVTAFWRSLLEFRFTEVTRYRARRADGQWRWLAVRGIPMCAQDGSVTEWLGTITDVTEQKAAEDALLSSNASLEAALADMTKALDAKRRAEDATIAKSNFLANMSHEIRTPMNGILGLAYLLEKNTLSADSRLLVQKIRATGGNLLGVINDILDFSKIEAGHLHIHSAAFDLDELLDHLATLMGAYTDSKPLVLAIAPPPLALASLVGDRLRLLQVLVNLTSNAIKFTPKGFVELQVDRVDEDADSVQLRFRVRDSGIGVPLSMQKSIFHPFEQGDMSSTREFGGTGLGLSISTRLVGLMGGSLQLSSTVAVGSSFSFTLTFGKSPRVADTPALAPLRYLIAHPCEVARQALGRTVASLGGVADTLEVPTAVAGRVREAAGQGAPYDVLLVDGQLAQHPVREWMDALSAQPALTPWPVILVLTDLAGNAMGASGQLDRIDAALSLPVSALALRTAVRSSLQRRAGFEPQPVTPVAPRLAGLRILVVDDSDINLEVAKRILVGEGARVDCASDGAQALIWLQLRSGDVDIVLMDVQMPAMDGYQTTRKIRELPALARIPVVALTAGVSDSHRDEAAAAGMNDFVTKPFDVEQIVLLILALTGRDTSIPTLPMQETPIYRSADMPQATPAMDIERAVSIWKDAGVYRKFLRKFARDYRLCVSEMRSTDVAAAKARAHKLRGAAGSLVLGGIVHATQELERCLASGANPESAYAALQSAFDEALLEIQAYAGSDAGDAQDPQPPAQADPARLRALLQDALLKLEEDSPSVVEPVLADLTTLLGAADLLPLRSALENYQFDACKRAVRALAARHHITLET